MLRSSYQDSDYLIRPFEITIGISCSSNYLAALWHFINLL
jgi:hypothetical protein